MGDVGEQAPGQPDVILRSRWERGQASYGRDHSHLQRRRKHHPYMNARALTILKPVHKSRRNHVSETARARTTLTLAHNSRQNNVGGTARAAPPSPLLTLPLLPRQRHRLRPRRYYCPLTPATPSRRPWRCSV